MNWLAFPTFPLATMGEPDITLALLIAIVLPVYALIEHLHDRAREARGLPTPILIRYLRSLIVLWGLAALVVTNWVSAGRSLASLGLSAPTHIVFWLSLGFVLLCGLFYGAQVITVRRSPTARAQVAQLLGRQRGVRDILPTTPAAIWTFRALALSAGLTEEVLFRGFLVWALAHWMDTWTAAALALAAFTAAHLYQESVRAIGGVFLAGAVLTALTLVSGSLVPAMILHAVVDLASGEMGWLARTEIAKVVRENENAPA